MKSIISADPIKKELQTLSTMQSNKEWFYKVPPIPLEMARIKYKQRGESKE